MGHFNFKKKLKEFGGSFVLIIPRQIIESLKAKKNQEVWIHHEEGTKLLEVTFK